MYNSISDLLDAIKEKRLKVSKLSKETGIPDQRIYKWKDRDSKISSEDAEILKTWIEKLDKSTNVSKEPEPKKESLQSLISSNECLSRAQEKFADAHVLLTKDHHDLLQMFKRYFNLVENGAASPASEVAALSVPVEKGGSSSDKQGNDSGGSKKRGKRS